MLSCHVEGGVAGDGEEGSLPLQTSPSWMTVLAQGSQYKLASAFWALPCHFKSRGLGEVKVS